jgi:hypothetical protein
LKNQRAGEDEIRKQKKERERKKETCHFSGKNWPELKQIPVFCFILPKKQGAKSRGLSRLEILPNLR